MAESTIVLLVWTDNVLKLVDWPHCLLRNTNLIVTPVKLYHVYLPPPLLTIVDLKILSVVSTPALVLCLYYRDEYVYYIAPKIEENGSTLNEKCLRSLETTGLELFSNFFQKHP